MGVDLCERHGSHIVFPSGADPFEYVPCEVSPHRRVPRFRRFRCCGALDVSGVSRNTARLFLSLLSLTFLLSPFHFSVVHGESSRGREPGGVASAPSKSGGGCRLILSLTTATAIASAIFGVCLVANGTGGVFGASLGAQNTASASFFPDVAVVGGASAASRERLKEDWNANHVGGFGAVRVVPSVDVSAWPESDDYGAVRKLIHATLGSTHGVEIATLDSDKERAFIISQAEESDEDVGDAIDEKSKSLQHLVAMLSAKSRNAKALLVADRDASISPLGGTFQHAHVGRPEEFDSVILSFLYKGPKKWDVLWCDKGAGGVEVAETQTPALVMTNEKWVGDYDVYRWRGVGGMSGAGLYLVSGTFLENLPTALRRSQFEDSNEWLASLCRVGRATCFSYLEKKTQGSDSKLATLGAANGHGSTRTISWRDTTVRVGGAREASLGALMVGGERAGDASAIRVNARDDESELGKTAKVFSLAEDESDALFQDSKPKAKHASKSVEHYAREQAKRKPAADVAEGPAPKKAAKGTMHGGSKSTKKSKPSPEEDSDVDSMLDWWTDVPETPVKGKAAKSSSRAESRHKTKTRGHERVAVDDDAVDDALNDALDAASVFIESDLSAPSGGKLTRKDATRASTSRGASRHNEVDSSKPYVPRGIETSPVLEREDDFLPDDPRSLERQRLISESVAKGDARDMRAASRMTDAAVDAAAEGRAASRSEGVIKLHTISPTEALRYVSRVHHKEEVEAAEAAAELATREEEIEAARLETQTREAATRGDALLDAADESYADIVDDAYADIVGEVATRRSWSAVGERNARGGEVDGEDEYEGAGEQSSEDEYPYEEYDYDYEMSDSNPVAARETSAKVPKVSLSHKTSAKAPEGTESSAKGASSPRSSSKSSRDAKHIRRPPTLKKSPHAVDVHLKHSKSGHISGDRHTSPRSTLGSKGDDGARGASPRAEAREATRSAGSATAAPAVGAELENGGAWRSAFTEAQNQAAYATRVRAVFDPANFGSRNAAALGASASTMPARLSETELAALVAAADASLDDFGPNAEPLAADTEVPY